ncbi:MAG: hypothetical protein Kow00100_21170 [Geothermobacteraceae bacterium]
MAAVDARKLARMLVLILFLAGLGLALFLATLDLNRYRDDIAGALSDLFERPVHFSSIAFSLEGGLAIDLRDLEVPPLPDRADRLTTRHLYLKVRLLPLLAGQISLRRILIDQPDLTIDLAAPAQANGEPSAKTASASPLAATGIREVRIRRGHISLLLPGQANRPLQLGDADLAVAATSGEQLQLELTGLLLRDSFQSPVLLTGRVSGDNPAEWLTRPAELDLVLKHFPLDAVGGEISPDLPRPAGTIELRTRLAGEPDGGYRVAMTVAGPDARLDLANHPPLPLDGLRLRALWHPAVSRQRVEDLQLDLPQGRLAGSLQLEDGSLAGDARLTIPTLTRLAGWLPEGLSLETGRLTARFDLEATRLSAPGTIWLDHLTSQLSVTDLTGRWRDLPPVHSGHIKAGLDAGSIILDEAGFEFLGQTQAARGSLELKEEGGQLQLEVDLNLPLDRAGELVRLPENLALAGSVPARLKLMGSLASPTVGFEADLTAARINLNGWLDKAEGEAARLAGQVRHDEGGWQLAGSRLILADNDAEISGQFRPGGEARLSIKGRSLDLARLASGRDLARYAIHGRAGVDLHLVKSTDAPLNVHGRISLHGAGVHLTSVVADLSDIRGQVVFKGRGFESLPLSARLGTSPVTIRTGMKSFDAPALKLHLRGKKVRTSELVFHNPDNHLNNLDGRITIDGRGISFDRVEVHLDGGTECVVTGAMSGWRQPRVDLEARASYANVDEVIALWTRGPQGESSKPPAGQPKRPGTKVVVSAETDRGRIGRFNFNHATATITSDGTGRLGVFPLHFRAGTGQGTGQVLADNRGHGPGRLRVTGHLEDFPAAAIHRELLQQKSIVDGTLRGDFFLEGETGAFLKTVDGGAHLEIRKGVLNRFTVLAKIFSLLNVSQLFSFKLPDMVQNGMPFDDMTASLAIEDGRLSSEDLLIHSEAMDISMVGSYDMPGAEIDAVAALKPLRTVDKIITKIPIAGWILGGKEKSLVTAQFRITGPAADPRVDAIPISSISSKVLGIFKRVLTLPGEVLMDPGKVLLPQSSKPE